MAIGLYSCYKFPTLGGGYRVSYTPMDDIGLLDSNNTIIIGGDIIKINFNFTYIIAEEKPRDIILKGTYDDPNMNIDNAENTFEESLIRQYWIINKIEDSIYGPLNKVKYWQKREELGIPKDLVLKKLKE